MEKKRRYCCSEVRATYEEKGLTADDYRHEKRELGWEEKDIEFLIQKIFYPTEHDLYLETTITEEDKWY